MQAEYTAVFGQVPGRGEEAFQKLLLQFSTAAAQSEASQSSSLIPLFCHATREFFQVDGAYFWQIATREELIGAEADGWRAEDFRGRKLKSDQGAVVWEAIRSRRAVYVNHPSASKFPMAAEFQAKSLMAVPLVVSDQVIGAAAFLHKSVSDYFNEDLAAKATIVAGQLGSLLEASRLTQISREEHRRAEILAEVAQALHAVPAASAVMEALTDRLRSLLRTRLVCILMREEKGFELRAVAAESSQLAAVIRARYQPKALQFASDLASRAIAAGEPITAAIDPASHGLGEMVPAGPLLAAPLRTSQTKGAVLIYPRSEGAFSPDEKSLVAAVAGFGAVAIANAELYSTAKAQAQEMHQLLEVFSELASIGNLDEFMRQFTLHTADFLSFTRAFIALREEGSFYVRWSASNGKSGPVNSLFPEGIATRALLNKEPFWSDDAINVPGAATDLISKYNVKQILTVPLLGANGDVLGMFGVLDKVASAPISQEDIRRARALSAQAAVALEATHNLHLAQQHRRRADSLMQLALELNSSVRLPEFAKQFVARAIEMTGARGCALVVKQRESLETIVIESKGASAPVPQDKKTEFGAAIARNLAKPASAIISSPAQQILGEGLAASLGWNELTLVRLDSASGEVMGVLCLADREPQQAKDDEPLLHAIASHASVALQNARLFSRMEHANRHWIEIFDAISDFIVVHDVAGDVLRVNRSLADFIGVPPQQLIGVNMRALPALGKDGPVYACPFCKGLDTASDEYVHPVLERTYLVSTSRVHAASSDGLQTIHVLKDITDRREAERRYRELFDNIQEGLFFSTPEGQFIEVNDAIVRMLGYMSREELLQARLSDHVYSSRENYQRFSQQMRDHGIVRNHEDTLRRRDGSVVHVLINAFAVRDRQGQILQYRGVMLDISGLKNFQAELQRERDFSGKILNNTQSLILVADTAGLISYANRRWHELGYEHRHMLGRPLQELVSAQRKDALEEAFQAVLTGQQVDNLDLQVLRGDGSIGQFSVNMSPMRDELGGVASLVVVMTDVTDAAMLQAKLIHAEKMAAVGQLVSGVAHEVNNPLTAILGFTDLLMENPELPESARRDLRVVLQEAQRTKQIVQNLLSFARQMPPQRKPVQLNIILHRTVQLRAYDLQNHGVQVIEQFDQQLPYVIGDSHQLQQVFLNIVNNAYDAIQETGRPPRIEIMTARSGDFVEVSFRDNGAGVSNPERIFDPFFTTKEIGKGTGLGLSICYGIIREHGGEILCHNNAAGEGATFIVRLPAASELASLGAAAGVLKR